MMVVLLWQRRHCLALCLSLLLLGLRTSLSFQISALPCHQTSSRSQRFLAPSEDDDAQPLLGTPSAPTPRGLLEPECAESQQLIQEGFGLSVKQYEKLRDLSLLVCDWNSRVNLVSRKDCSPSVVWTRHVLPSVAAYGDRSLPIHSARTVVDVGTGGGFPGLPLAIAFPDVQFLLLDSVGKKLAAVQDMANELGLSNVNIHHGRAEEYVPDKSFDVATGRSVSSLPQFCSWMHHLVDGSLMYWIGSNRADNTDGGVADDIPRDILDVCGNDVAIEPLLRHLVPTDKRILTFDRAAVGKLASLPYTPKHASEPSPRTKKPWNPPRMSEKRSERSTSGKARPVPFSRQRQRDDESWRPRKPDTFRRYDSNGPKSKFDRS
jgi:16S rRNA (guanine527-N7)-methyltransferase